MLKNFGALLLVQSTNFLIPLITFPYLLRTVGTIHFGAIAYCLSILTYLTIATDYGFNLTATRAVSLNRDDTSALSRIFTSVTYTKALFYGFCFGIAIVLCFVLPRLQTNRTLFILGMLFVLGNTLMPIWFFQGIERMKYIAYVNVVAKVIQLSLIVVFVTQPVDYIWVLAIYGVANIGSGVYGLVLLRKRYAIRLLPFQPQDIRDQISVGWPIFLSNILTIFIINGNIFFVGLYVSDQDLGAYSIVEKVIFTVWSVLNLFVQLIYPRACKLATESHGQLVTFLCRVVSLATSTVIVGCIGLYLLAQPIIRLITGQTEETSVALLRIMSVIPVIVILNTLPVQYLLAHDLKKRYTAVIYIIAIINMLITPFLIRYNGVFGASQAIITTQIIMTLAFYAAAWKPFLNQTRHQHGAAHTEIV